MNPAAIINKIDNALRTKVGDPARPVYKRTFTRAGTDAEKLLGRTTETHVDVKLDPQPTIDRLGTLARQIHRDIPVLGSDAKRFFATDYVLTMSSTSMNDTDFQNPNILIVFKDDDGTEEVCDIIDIDDPAVLGGVTLMYTVIIRSRSR